MVHDAEQTVFQRIRAALGRAGHDMPTADTPKIEEPLVRRVHIDIGLPELFARMAEENKIHVTMVHTEEIPAGVLAILREHGCRKVALAGSPVLEKLDLSDMLKTEGFETRIAPAVTLDELYDFDCGITDVAYAVAETGSLVIRPTPQHPRALSLVPPIHIAIVEPRDLLPDLVDLFEKLAADPYSSSATTIITGPSKTADIEMNIVVGVHGPRLVHVFLLS
jgi:L-lactate dehydrogenase complex protein LldG